MHLRDDFVKIVLLFLGWRLLLVVFSVIAINFIPLGSKDRFLGGGYNSYQLSPHFFSWANFDGEHYLSISIFGYKSLEQAFFPLYPGVISIISKPISLDFPSLTINSIFVGLLISNLAFLISLILLYDLIRLDFSKKIAFWVIIALLIFPTSFYFASLYNESLFLLLSISTFYFVRKQKWWLAGILGMIASATRVFGILIFFALLIEAWQQKKSIKEVIWICLIPLGLLFYMYYQWIFFQDPFSFYNLQTIVGEQHQKNIILFPQIIFRYFKMLFTVNFHNPIYQTLILEFVTGIMFLILPIYGYFKKIRLSYIFYALVGFLLPTIQGSLSSSPRYILILFPSFLCLALLISGFPKWGKITYVLFSLVFLGIETMLFLRGFWVA